MLYIFTTIKNKISWALVAHTCNPSYSGGRDQEDHSSNPAGANSLQDPISKKKKSQNGAGSNGRVPS
jgi:hypothetical protein